MRKLIFAAMAVAGLVAQTGYAADRFELQPEGGAYLSLGFDGPAHREIPFHYGLTFGYERAITQLAASQMRFEQPGLALLPAGDRSTTRRAPLLSVDLDRRGDGVASIGGIPFARHVVALKQDGSDGSGQPGGFTTVDWGLLVVGLGGAGYLLSQVVKSNSSPNPPAPASSGSSSCPGIVCLPLVSAGGESGMAATIPAGPQWLNQDHGQMGDLQPR